MEDGSLMPKLLIDYYIKSHAGNGFEMVFKTFEIAGKYFEMIGNIIEIGSITIEFPGVYFENAAIGFEIHFSFLFGI